MLLPLLSMFCHNCKAKSLAGKPAKKKHLMNLAAKAAATLEDEEDDEDDEDDDDAAPISTKAKGDDKTPSKGKDRKDKGGKGKSVTGKGGKGKGGKGMVGKGKGVKDTGIGGKGKKPDKAEAAYQKAYSVKYEADIAAGIDHLRAMDHAQRAGQLARRKALAK